MRGETQTSIDINRSPRPLAEFLPPEELKAAVARYETRRNPEGLFRSAWNYTEQGLNQLTDEESDRRAYYFQYAQSLIGMLMHRDRTHQDTLLGALVLSTYLPVFQKRGLDETVTSEDCRDVYRSLGGAMAYLQPLDVDVPPQWRMAETAVLALAARTSNPDLLLYPTSPREEMSAEASLNHDSYFFDNDSKIPIQQKLIKTSRSYDEWITVLTLQPLVEKGFRKIRLDNPEDLTDQINYLISLIVAETTGSRLEGYEKDFLNYLSKAVAAHRFRAKNEKQAA
ncbi:MAG TPA: hypothetical protein PK096_04090 [Candidatus Saccharibacteria bacterium]|nr:hypothetical protein [Candidatus Saccharibacteria bacterium]HRK94522.1 hypothetical protein [Candidatus Saccharibacteria bacterium]